MTSTFRDGFHELWPTLFLHRRIDGYEAPNRYLRHLVLEREAAASDMTTDYASYNFFDTEHDAVSWLEQCVNKTVGDYLRRMNIDYDVHWRLQGWANVNRDGDYHNLHNHPHSYLSGTYYVAVPGAYRIEGRRNDINPGAISFFDPRAQSNMNAIRGDRQVNPEHRVDPREGEILLWPSFLHHFVHPNLSGEPRISVSFNILLKWSNDYLPPQ